MKDFDKMHQADMVLELRSLETRLRLLMTQPPGFEKMVKETVDAIHELKIRLEVERVVCDEATVVMLSTGARGQMQFRTVHPDDVATLHRAGWKLAEEKPPR